MCRRRNQRPLVVTAGVLAYNEIKKHQQNKRDRAFTNGSFTSETPIPSSNPITTTSSVSELPAHTPNTTTRGSTVDSPPDYDSIDSLVHNKNAYGINEKDHLADVRPIHSSDIRSSPLSGSSPGLASPDQPTDQLLASSASSRSVVPPTASYRVYSTVHHGILHHACLTSQDARTVYQVRYKDKKSSVRVRRGCRKVATATLLSDGTAELSLDTLGLTSMSRHPQTAAWDFALPTGYGGMRQFSWRGAVGQEAVGSWVWRLEDEKGEMLAVFMDDLWKHPGGKLREGVMNVVERGLSQKMVDVVVASCFAMVKQKEREVLA